MSHDWLPFVAAVPVILGLLVVGARAFLSVSQGPVAARLQSAVPAYETVLDWGVHFSVGTMLLGISTALVVELSASPVALIGLFTGVVAACTAFVMARPPLREEATNPEMDGRSFALSALVHSVLGVALASLLIAAS